MPRSVAHAALIAGTVVAVGAGVLVAAASVAAKGAAIPAGNLVQNPGAEANRGGDYVTARIAPNGWTKGAGDGIQVLRYGAHGYNPTREVGVAIGGGANFFQGGYPSSSGTAFQLLDVSGAAPEVDSGGVKACLSAYLGGFRTDPSWARIDVEFLDADEGRLGQLRVGPVTRGHRKDATTLVRRAAQRAVPRNTRQLRVVIVVQGPNLVNRGMADNISVALTRGACEPVLAVRCQGGALVATVTPSAIARPQRVTFRVRGARGSKQVVRARAPFSARIPMSGLTGQLTVAAVVNQAGSGPITLTRKSRRC
jgi:hypothetical protein